LLFFLQQITSHRGLVLAEILGRRWLADLEEIHQYFEKRQPVAARSFKSTIERQMGGSPISRTWRQQPMKPESVS